MRACRAVLSVLAAVVMISVALPARATAPLVEISGAVTAVTGSVITLGGIVKIDATSAVITDRGTGATLGIADVVVGAEVEASITGVAADGTFLASEIKVGPRPTVELSGQIEAIDTTAGTLKVKGVTVTTDASTVFSGQTARGPVTKLSDLQVGDQVEVKAVSSGTTLLALSVHAESESGGEKVEFNGTVQSQTATSWVVSGRTVNITATTMINGSPAVGDNVHVVGSANADGSVTAMLIVKIGSGSDHGNVSFNGIVSSISATSWTIGGRTVAVNASTRILGSPHVGDTVHVVATQAADGTLTALVITRNKGDME